MKIWRKQCKYLAQFDNIKVTRGGLDLPGAKALRKLLKKVACDHMQCMELGSWTGQSSIVIADYISRHNGKLDCLDWFRGSENANLDVAKLVNIKEIFLANVRQSGLTNVTIKQAASEVAAVSAGDNSYDFIFIDGDHRYEHVSRDIQLWLPKVKKGGILCGHDCEYLVKDLKDLYTQTANIDYTQAHLGVIRAVCELLPRAKLTKKGYIWWVRK